MTEQKYRLTVNTPSRTKHWTFDGTLDDIISQLERSRGDLNDPPQTATPFESSPATSC